MDLDYIRRKHHHSDIAVLCAELEAARSARKRLMRLFGDLYPDSEVGHRLGNILRAWEDDDPNTYQRQAEQRRLREGGP